MHLPSRQLICQAVAPHSFLFPPRPLFSLMMRASLPSSIVSSNLIRVLRPLFAGNRFLEPRRDCLTHFRVRGQSQLQTVGLKNGKNGSPPQQEHGNGTSGPQGHPPRNVRGTPPNGLAIALPVGRSEKKMPRAAECGWMVRDPKCSCV